MRGVRRRLHAGFAERFFYFCCGYSGSAPWNAGLRGGTGDGVNQVIIGGYFCGF